MRLSNQNVFHFLQQWIDLARATGLQAKKSQPASDEAVNTANIAALGCNTPEDSNIEDINSTEM